ncbi:MAG: lipoprotein-anchoring transpeptidase ErfK/SrfK, partial [Arenicella sp.]
PHKSWAKFLWLDYPNKESWKKHRQAKANGTIPQNATIGGEIGIHGVPEGYDHAIAQKQNWTLGCISLTRPAINEIYNYVKAGTVVEIRK